MNSIRSFAIYVLASLGFISQANAQSTPPVSDPTGVSVPGTAASGSTISVNYHDPNRAGQTITIQIENGEPGNERKTTSVEITLDQNGDGATEWVVPDWDGALFNDGVAGSTETSMVIS